MLRDNEAFFRRRPRQERSRAAADAVVTALEQLIDRVQDFGELSIRAIAERAGVGVGSVYDYFKSQDALFGEFLSILTERNFERLSVVVESTNDRPLHEALVFLVDQVVATYLHHPRRTRAAIALIVRLGQIEFVVRERDRFAAVVAARVRRERPELGGPKLEAAMRLVMDVGMGVIMTELWRPTPEIRTLLLDLFDAVFERMIGVQLLTEPANRRPGGERIDLKLD